NPDHGLAKPITFQWEFTDPDIPTWHLTVENGSSVVSQGKAPNPDLRLRLAYQDWADIVGERLDPLRAVATGRLRPRGNPPAPAVGAAGDRDGRAGPPPDGAPPCSGPNSRLARLLAAGERTGVAIACADPAAPGAGVARLLSSAAGAAAEAEPREALSARARACAREELRAAPWLVLSTAQPAPTPSASRQPAASLALTPPPASNQP